MRAHIHDRYPDHNFCRANELRRVLLYTAEYPEMLDGPLLEKIRLDNATVQRCIREVETILESNKSSQRINDEKNGKTVLVG